MTIYVYQYAVFLFDATKLIHDNLQRVLFGIDTTPKHESNKLFANISSKSYFVNECEVLVVRNYISFE
jgi:hypothetical protein